MLALALVQVLTGQRPSSQLIRWLDEDVMTTVRYSTRRSEASRRARTSSTPAAPSTAVVSVRAQCPSDRAVEASAHLRIGRRFAAMAFRLEAFGDRWLCTALEVAPRSPGAGATYGEAVG